MTTSPSSTRLLTIRSASSRRSSSFKVGRSSRSRAILEVVKGRIDIVEKFYTMIVQNAPETAPTVGDENLHDLIAQLPWLINPEWQVLYEERSVTAQLREWGNADLDPDDRTRYDFLGLKGDGQLIVIEIKRAGHAATVDDLQQLERYVSKLGSRPIPPSRVCSSREATTRFFPDCSRTRKKRVRRCSPGRRCTSESRSIISTTRPFSTASSDRRTSPGRLKRLR